MSEEAENSGGGSLKGILIGLASTIALGVGGLSVQNMCQTLINGMDGAFENWKPRKKYELFKIK